MRERLMTLARRVEEKADDLEIIRRQGNRVLVRLGDGLGGTLKKYSRADLEHYETELDA